MQTLPDSPSLAPATTPATAPDEPTASARERLLRAGLRLFALQGYGQTSVRELAEAAQVNVAAISYYFGDKAGLYRAACFEPLGDAESDVQRIIDPSLSLPEALGAFYAGFLEPLRQGDALRLCTRLHFREMLEPTGLWDELVDQGIRPLHDALLVVLQRHLDAPAPDEELLGLAVNLTALGVHLHVGHDVTVQLAPALLQGDAALGRWAGRLERMGVAMVQAERARRAGAPPKPSAPTAPTPKTTGPNR